MLWPLSVMPTVIFLLLGAGLFAGMMHVVETVLSHATIAKLDGILKMPGMLVAKAIGAGLAAFSAYKAAKVFSAPILDKLGEKVEVLEGDKLRPQPTIAEGLWRSLRVSVFGLLVLIVGTWLIGTATIFVPLLAVISGPLQIALLAVTAAWDMLDYPYGRRHYGVRARLHAMRENVPACLGFGCGYLMLVAVPGMLLVSIVIGSVAATRLIIQEERAATT